MMSDRIARRKKKFLMGVNEYWLVEDTLMPMYAHLVDSYAEKVKNEWKVEVIKVEDFQEVNIEGRSVVKEEDVDDRLSVFHSVDEECTTNVNGVIIFLWLEINNIDIDLAFF